MIRKLLPIPLEQLSLRELFREHRKYKQLKLSMTYPMTVGRNFAEVLRALDGLQTSTGKGVATPANWNVGDDVIIPATVSNEDAAEKFGEFTTVLPYLRTTKLKD